MDVSRACNRQGGAGDPRAPRTARRLPRERLPRAEPWSGGSPDPIPNSAVKPHLAESTAAPGRGRTGRSARRGRFSAFRPPWRDGRTCRCRGSDGHPASPLVWGAARRPLGPEAGQFRAPAGPSPTSPGEPVRQNYIIIWTPMRVSFCFCAPLTVKWERLLSLKI